jgi:alkanesulfonate monooxygenase SsuD/methylene tetrahydromethanopterin reductase-like flavin-dependent oxidoreductase (luciferase family)
MRIDLAGFGREGVVPDHRRFIAMFERADRLGFDGVWFNEFHFNRDTLRYPSTLMLGAEILARTERLRFGTSVLLIALQHPLILAEQVAQLDYQSGGRVDLGVGRSTAPETLAALGVDPKDTRARFERALAIMRGAWTQEATSTSGPDWRFSDVAVGPPPVQKPHPPIYVAGYSPETIVFAADNDLPLLFSLQPPETGQMLIYRERLAKRGTVEPLRRSSLSRFILVGATERAAGELVDTLLAQLNKRRADRALKGGVPAPELLREQAIAGVPERCIEQIAALVRASGVEGLRCYFNGNGALPDETAMPGMELFAREVVPALRRIVPLKA